MGMREFLRKDLATTIGKSTFVLQARRLRGLGGFEAPGVQGSGPGTPRAFRAAIPA
jgi:hypothetical protein